jgi:hypothetical protein
LLSRVGPAFYYILYKKDCPSGSSKGEALRLPKGYRRERAVRLKREEESL